MRNNQQKNTRRKETAGNVAIFHLVEPQEVLGFANGRTHGFFEKVASRAKIKEAREREYRYMKQMSHLLKRVRRLTAHGGVPEWGVDLRPSLSEGFRQTFQSKVEEGLSLSEEEEHRAGGDLTSAALAKGVAAWGLVRMGKTDQALSIFEALQAAFEKRVPSGFEGEVPWSYEGNRAYLKAVWGRAAALVASGEYGKGFVGFRRLAFGLDPSDGLNVKDDVLDEVMELAEIENPNRKDLGTEKRAKRVSFSSGRVAFFSSDFSSGSVSKSREGTLESEGEAVSPSEKASQPSHVQKEPSMEDQKSAVPPVSPEGCHVIADLHGADARLLEDADAVEKILRSGADRGGAKVVGCSLHSFGQRAGITGVLLLAESHISIHTWPEHQQAQVDVFMCGQCDPHEAMAEVTAGFDASRLSKRSFVRGGEKGIEEEE